MPVIINGTTGLSGVSTVNLANGSVTQNILANGVAGTGPAFRAYASSATNIANTTYTKLVFVTEEFDTNNCYDTSTSRFTPNVAGIYVFTAAHYVLSAETGGYFSLYMYKNGSQIGTSPVSNATGIYTNAVTTIAYANGTTDYFEAYAYQSSGATRNSSTGTNYYFAAAMLRAA